MTSGMAGTAMDSSQSVCPMLQTWRYNRSWPILIHLENRHFAFLMPCSAATFVRLSPSHVSLKHESDASAEDVVHSTCPLYGHRCDRLADCRTKAGRMQHVPFDPAWYAQGL